MRREPAPRDDERDDEIVRRLGAWFDANKRDLPWRRTRDPYAIWLSEVMLQQTRVKTVLAYWGRFLDRFPTVEALSRAPLDDVLAAWSGHGYYRRARALHHAAREMVARYGDRVPDDPEALRAIPGIGPYTAGAVASLAFDRRAALVDGNVARVYARLFGVDADVRSPAGVKAMWAIAERVVPAERPGRHNEALMELGATVCLPREPRCDACPLAGACVARAEGRQAELPVAAPKKAPRVVAMTALVARRASGEVLLGKRGDAGLFAGLWEPPMVEGGDEEALGALARAVGASAISGEPLGRVVHVLTHRELRIDVIGAPALRRGPAPKGGPYVEVAWVAERALGERGVSTLARKVLRAGAAR